MGTLSNLARFRVHDILLVSSLYDSFILAEDGELQEVILKEFLDLNVRHTPGVTHVSTAAEALTLARDRGRYNLVIASMYLGDGSAHDLARRMREAGIDTPVVALAYDIREVGQAAAGSTSPVERVFLYGRDTRFIQQGLSSRRFNGTVERYRKKRYLIDALEKSLKSNPKQSFEKPIIFLFQKAIHFILST